MSFRADFRRDFEDGVVIRARLGDHLGRVHPGCEVEVRQPGPVYDLQSHLYRLDVKGDQAVALLASTRRLEVFALQASFSRNEVQVVLQCGQSPRVRSSDAGGASPNAPRVIVMP